jgi:hypothetical protein
MKDLRRIPPDCQLLKQLAALLPEAAHGCIQCSQTTTSATAERGCQVVLFAFSPASPSEMVVMIKSIAGLSTRIGVCYVKTQGTCASCEAPESCTSFDQRTACVGVKCPTTDRSLGQNGQRSRFK